MGHKFKIKSAVSDEYGSGHVNLMFKCEKFIVEADAVRSIFLGDLIRAKVGYPLDGIRCLNKNNDTKKEFYEKVSKVYKMVEKEFKARKEDSFDDVIQKYQNLSNAKTNISFDEKLSILANKIFENKSSFSNMDMISYSVLLIKNLFTENEKMENIRFAIFKDGETDKAKMLIAINKKGFGDKHENKYIIYEPNNGVQFLTQEQLNYSIKKQQIIPVDKSKVRIPGVEV